MNAFQRFIGRPNAALWLGSMITSGLIIYSVMQVVVEDPLPFDAIPRSEATTVEVRQFPRRPTNPIGAAESQQTNLVLEDAANPLSPPEIPRMLAELTARKQGDDRSHAEWQRLLRRWGRVDPHAAASWADSLPVSDSETRTEALNCVLIAWANSNLQAAAGWVSNWPDGAERDAALTAVAYEGARTNPVAAVQMAADMSPTQETWNLIGYAVSQWATIDPVAALQWTRQIEDVATREMLLSNVTIAWAASDPVQASRAMQELSSGRPCDDAIVGIAQHWVQIDRAAARQWLDRSACSPQSRAGALQAMSAIDAHLHER